MGLEVFDTIKARLCAILNEFKLFVLGTSADSIAFEEPDSADRYIQMQKILLGNDNKLVTEEDDSLKKSIK